MKWQLAIWHVIATVGIVLLFIWWFRSGASIRRSDPYPNRPIQVVVPYAAGGGSDTFVRIMQKGIIANDLLPQPLVVVNQPGGIGTIGSREVKNSRPNGYKILCHHNAIITAKLAGTVPYGPEAFEPIAMTGEMSMVVLVRGDSPYSNLHDLLQDARQNPRQIRFGANQGAPAYFTALQLERAVPGAELSIVSSGGGADRYAKILGGHLEAGIFSLSEYLDFRGVEGTPPQRDIKAIAVLGHQRHESIPHVPTAAETGVPVTLSNANYWWAPQGTPAEVIEYLATVLEQTLETEVVRSELRRIRMDPTFDRGQSLNQRIEATVEQFESVTAGQQQSIPNFLNYVTVIVAILLTVVILNSIFAGQNEELSHSPLPNDPPPKLGLAFATLSLLCLYIWLLQQGFVAFAWTSTAAIIVTGSLILFASQAQRRRQQWLVLCELALLTGFGSQFVFTEILRTPLP